MTPTADLMKMPFYDGTIEDFLRDHGICAGDRKALVAALTASCDARVGEPVAWYVFADTEHWVTMDRDEADENLDDGCQVRPLIFGDHLPAPPSKEG